RSGYKRLGTYRASRQRSRASIVINNILRLDPTLSMRLVLAALLILRVHAQDFRATIVGQVFDQSGSAIAGVKIRAVQRGTNQLTVAVSNQDGYYTLPYLQPSTYDIDVEATGFNKLRRENVTLMVAEKLDLPLLLELGQVSE